MNVPPKKDLASNERDLFCIKPITVTPTHKNKTTSNYRGRFAPSPSGPLHFGSLVAAVASFCQAKAQRGTWIVRMEDIDPPRELPRADTLIIDCLNAHGLISDEPIIYQSQRTDIYSNAITYLAKKDKIFYCSCSRKSLRKQLKNTSLNTMSTTLYPGTCRHNRVYTHECSTRLFAEDQIIYFNDEIYGLQAQELCSAVGDFVLQRRDGLFSYQLAVVVDDIAQQITEVVRGVDLIDSTQRQLYVYQCLGHTPPNYMHLPLALMADGKKLSKQTGAQAIDNTQASRNLWHALVFLGQKPNQGLVKKKPIEILNWAIRHWDTQAIKTDSKVVNLL